jgi:hypothetical protein
VLLLLSPLLGAVVLTWWLGAYALVFGAMLLGLAFKLKGRRDAGPGTQGSRPRRRADPVGGRTTLAGPQTPWCIPRRLVAECDRMAASTLVEVVFEFHESSRVWLAAG